MDDKEIGVQLIKLHQQGYRLTLFCQKKAGPLTQNDWGPSPKLRGPGFGGKLVNSTPLPSIGFTHT